MKKAILTTAMAMAVISTSASVADAKELICAGPRPHTGVKVVLDDHPYMVSLSSHQKKDCKYVNKDWLVCNIGETRVESMYGNVLFAIHNNRNLYMGMTFNNIFKGTTLAQKEYRTHVVEQEGAKYGFACSRENPVLPHADMVCMSERPLLKCKEE